MIMQDGEAEMHVDRSELPAGRENTFTLITYADAES